MMKISLTNLGKMLNISARSISRYEADQVINRDADGLYDLERSLSAIHRHLRARTTIAERICRRFAPHLLEDLYKAEYLLSD